MVGGGVFVFLFWGGGGGGGGGVCVANTVRYYTSSYSELLSISCFFCHSTHTPTTMYLASVYVHM